MSDILPLGRRLPLRASSRFCTGRWRLLARAGSGRVTCSRWRPLSPTSSPHRFAAPARGRVSAEDRSPASPSSPHPFSPSFWMPAIRSGAGRATRNPCHSWRRAECPSSEGDPRRPRRGAGLPAGPSTGTMKETDADYADYAEARRFSLYQESGYSRATKLPGRALLRNLRNLRPSASGLFRSSR